MPELPEVETIARDLERSVRGATIERAMVHRPDVLRECTPRTLSRRVQGAAVDRCWRRAKYAVMDLSTGDRIVVSPRFTGALLVETRRTDPGAGDYTAVRFPLRDGRVLRYRDVRRLGTVALMAPGRFEAWEAALGPEPFDAALTDERFASSVRGSARAIKTILMDQRRVAGIGNIYANEALWRAGIRPARRGTRVTRAESARLLAAARDVMGAALAMRGTSFRDYRDAHGEPGAFAELLRVYGREGQPCLRCGTPLRWTHALEGRISVWCPRCQR